MKKRIASILLVLALALSLLPMSALADDDAPESGTPSGTTVVEAALQEGVNVIDAGAENTVYTIDSGKAVALKGSEGAPITFTNCTFNISGQTMSISGSGVGYNGETITRFGVGQYVTFNNCVFNVTGGGTISGSGNDACIEFFGPGITFNDSSITGTNWQGQFLGLYGSAVVTFNNSTLATTGNTGGWSYAMYGASVLNLNSSTMTATGMQRKEGGGNINAFYSGDARTGYDAINITDSKIDFSDNQAGGFAINNVNIHVTSSTITVNNNLGNACNSGYWIVNESSITMDGNKGGHALSCIGFEMEDSTLEILHNGYAGLYIQSKDSSFTNCTVDIRCNGEKLLSYSAGDVWLNSHTLALKDCKHVWLGGVGRKGTVTAENCPYVVAYDLVENGTKSNTESVLTGVTLSEQDEHLLFLNPSKNFDYARGDTEGEAGNSNDDDLFEDVGKEIAIGAETAKIGTLTTAQLSHHLYDWDNGKITDPADATHYGVIRYECVDVCADYAAGWTAEHPYSFDCDHTYVYAPLVGLHFDANAGSDPVIMPDDQAQIEYNGNAEAPGVTPVRYDTADDWNWVFTGWYADPECTVPYDFSTPLKDNWTIVYAGWEKVKVGEGALSISKTVNGGSLTEEFTFTVTLTGADGQKLSDTYVYTGSKSGEITSGGTVTLKNGQTVAIQHLPVDATYTVTETPVSGYTTTISGNDANMQGTIEGNTASGTIVSGSAAVVHYTNTKPVSAGGGTGSSILNTEDHYSYIIGYKDGTVRPYGYITRGEVATIFFRLLTDEIREEYWCQTNDYSDCSSDLWCNNAISTLTNLGIIDGFNDGTFRPYAKITRAQFAKMAVGFFETTQKAYAGYFSDVPANAWYTQYVEAAARVGLIQGFSDGTFRPNTNITRAQACVIINRALGRKPDVDHLLDEDEMITWVDNNPSDWFYADMQEATNSHDYDWLSVKGLEEAMEEWTAKLPQRDWAALEHAWSTAHSAPGGEVTR